MKPVGHDEDTLAPEARLREPSIFLGAGRLVFEEDSIGWDALADEDFCGDAGLARAEVTDAPRGDDPLRIARVVERRGRGRASPQRVARVTVGVDPATEHDDRLEALRTRRNLLRGARHSEHADEHAEREPGRREQKANEERDHGASVRARDSELASEP